jgi:anhydro-N-acetylmuramic acid kinase
MVIDECVRVLTNGAQLFDEHGAMAARGNVDEIWLDEILRHAYFRLSPPKTCGREQFGAEYAQWFLAEAKRRNLGDDDCVATATALTAASMVQSYNHVSTHNVPVDVILCGGGAFNVTLQRMIAEYLKQENLDFALHRLEDFGWQSDAKEAIAFAVLAYLTMMNLPGNVPAATGARRPVVLGKIVLSG